MSEVDRNCYNCKHFHYKDKYCENLELRPGYPELGCGGFEDKGMEDIAIAFQFGLALGFGERHDEMDKVIDEIKKVITPQPKIGHWIIYDVHGHKACKCSECDKDVGYPCNYEYCPYCGYRMLKPQESEEESKTGACKNCRWKKDSDEVFRRGVSMEDLCAACHIRSNRK